MSAQKGGNPLKNRLRPQTYFYYSEYDYAYAPDNILTQFFFYVSFFEKILHLGILLDSSGTL